MHICINTMEREKNLQEMEIKFFFKKGIYQELKGSMYFYMTDDFYNHETLGRFQNIVPWLLLFCG